MSKELVQRIRDWRAKGIAGTDADAAADLIERIQKIVDQSTGHPAEKLAKIARVLLPQPPSKGE